MKISYLILFRITWYFLQWNLCITPYRVKCFSQNCVTELITDIMSSLPACKAELFLFALFSLFSISLLRCIYLSGYYHGVQVNRMSSVLYNIVLIFSPTGFDFDLGASTTSPYLIIKFFFLFFFFCTSSLYSFLMHSGTVNCSLKPNLYFLLLCEYSAHTRYYTYTSHSINIHGTQLSN